MYHKDINPQLQATADGSITSICKLDCSKARGAACTIDKKQGRHCIAHYQNVVIEWRERYDALELRIETGRLERIATAIAAGLAADPECDLDAADAAMCAIERAESLITRLDGDE